MMMRFLQVGCLLVLGSVASSSSVDARSMWEGPCAGRQCTQCGDPNPSGSLCWVGGSNTCQQYGCSAFVVCGPELEYVQCECEPCIT